MVLEILPLSSLPNTGYILITIPEAFTLTQPSACLSLNIVASKETAVCSLTGNLLKISELFYSAGYDPLTDQAIKIRVNNIGIIPDSVQQLEFQIKTFADVNEPVDASQFILSDLLEPGKLLLEY